MSSKKVIDIANSLEFIKDYNANGITGSNSRISTSDNGELLLYYNNPSVNSTTGTVVLYNGGLSINTTELSTSYTSGGGLTIRGGGAISGDLYIGSNIYVASNVSTNTLLASELTVGNINFTGDLYQNGSIYVSSQWISDTNGNIFYTGGNVSISTTSSMYSLDIGGTTRSQDILATNSTITTLNVSGLTVGNINFTGNLYQNGSVYISSQWFSGTGGTLSYTNGNVGIGTTSPNSKLDIRGDINVSGDSNSSVISATKNGDVLIIKNSSSVGNSSIDFENNSGNSKLYIGYANSGSALTNLIGSGYLLTENAVSLKIVSGNNISNPVIINANDNSVSVTTTTDSIDIYSGALKVSGGASVEKTLYVGDDVHVSRDLYVDGAINGAANSSSTFAYLTLTSTDSAINFSTGSMVTYGGITIQSTQDALSITNGGSFLTPGGASIGKSLYVGDTLHANTITVANIKVDNITMGTTITELNLGLSNIYSGSFTPSNNVTSFSNIVPLVFDSSIIRSFTVTLTASITADTNLYETFVLEGVQTDAEWDMYTSSYGDSTNITFDITSNGEIQYTTPNFPGFIDAIFNYQVSQIRKTGSSQYTGVATNGTLILNTIQLLGTEDSNRGINNGALYIAGGCSIEKSLYSANSSFGNSKFINISSGNINVNGNLIVGGTLTTVNITTTNISETNVSSGNLSSINANITSITIANENVITSTIGTLITTNVNATTGTVGNLIGTNVNITTSTIGTIISNNANITISTLGSFIGSNTSIGNANVTTGTVGTLISTNANVTTSSIGTLVGSSATIVNANVTTGTVGTLIATNANITTSTIGSLVSPNSNITTGTIGSLTCTNSNVTTQTIGNLVSNNMNVTTGTISSLISSNATVTNSNVTTSTIGTMIGSNIIITNSNITNETVGTLVASTITTTNLIVTNVSSNTIVSNVYTGGSMSLTGNVNLGGSGYQLNIKTTSSVSGAYVYLDGTTSTSGKSYAIGSSLSANLSGSGNLEFFDVTSSAIRMIISSSGNIGIGTIFPSYRLDVSGSLRATSGDITLGSLLVSNANVTTSSIGTLVGSSATFSTLSVIGGGGLSVTNNISSAGLTVGGNGLVLNGEQNVTNITPSTSTTTGAIRVSGGVGIAGSLNVGGTINAPNANVTTGTVGTLIGTNSNVTTSSVGTLIVTNANVTVSTVGTLLCSSATVTNNNVTTQTVGTSRITSNLLAVGNSNTVGNIFTTGGNVGIATTSPTFTLDVSGSARMGGNGFFRFTNDADPYAHFGGSTLSGDARLNVQDRNGALISYYVSTTKIAGTSLVNNNALYINMGSNGANQQLALADQGSTGFWGFGAANGAVQYMVGSGASGAHLFYTNSTTGQSNAALGTERMRIAADGRVTIGGALQVGTNLLALGNSNTVGNIFTTGGNVGIGVTNPVNWSQLHLKTPSSVSGAFLYLDASTSASGKNYAIGSSLSSNISGAGNLEFFDATSDVARMVIGSTGNVGIANNTPGYRLDVSGSFRATSGDVTLGSTLVTNSNVTTQTTGTSRITTSLLAVGNSNTVGNIFTTGGNVGIGTTSPGSVVDVRGVSSWGTFRMAPSTSGGEVGIGFFGLNDFTASAQSTSGNWLLGTGIVALGASNFGLLRNTTPIFVISTAGNVGIGTTSPNSRLSIITPDPATNFSLMDFRNTGGYGIYVESSSISSRGNTMRFLSTDFNITGGSVTRDVLTLRPEGFVGVGINAPQAPLHIVGNSINSSSTVGGIMMGTDSGNYARIEMVSTTGSYIDFTTTGTDALGRIIYDVANNYFDINTNGVARLRLNSLGNMTLTGDLTVFGSISDIRFKKDIESLDVETGFNIINKLRPVSFTWNEDMFNISKRNTRDIGFIAQEVEQVTEYIVDDFEEIGSGEIYKKMKHERLIPYLVLSIQKLNKENEKKNNEIENLKTIIKDLLQKFD
jgi:hypothetical protein